MKRSEFRASLAERFDPRYAQALLHDLVLPGLGSRTASDALEGGEDPQRVWDALVIELRLPEDARFPHRSGDTPRH